MGDVIVEGLNKLLADATLFRFKAQQRHWNIRGPMFFTLHNKFEEQYTAWSEIIDELAERVLSLGSRPLTTLEAIISHASIQESPEETDDSAMVRGVLTDMAVLRERMLEVSKLAQDADDKSTENLLDPWIDDLAKQQWMFAAYLGEGNRAD